MVDTLPSQCSVSVWSVAMPTAQMSVEEIAAIACKRLSRPGTLGLGTMVHALPSQCSTSVCRAPIEPIAPTAQTLLADRAATPLSVLSPWSELGLATTRQARPHAGVGVVEGDLAAASLARGVWAATAPARRARTTASQA